VQWVSEKLVFCPQTFRHKVFFIMRSDVVPEGYLPVPVPMTMTVPTMTVPTMTMTGSNALVDIMGSFAMAFLKGELCI
jgi:hypothetical protein